MALQPRHYLLRLKSVNLEFHDECLKFHIGIVSKLRERSPLRYKLSRVVSTLNPVIIYYSPDLGKKIMN